MRFVQFSGAIAGSSSPQMRLLHSIQSTDWRSTYGRNYLNIINEEQATSMEKVNPQNVVVNPVPWGGVELLDDLLADRDSMSGFLTMQQLESCIEEVCTN